MKLIHLNQNIDYSILSEAIKHYKSLGYAEIAVPWIVSMDSLLYTLPVGKEAVKVLNGSLVGSGEQSFIELLKDKKEYPFKKAFCITPCFRDEDIEGDSIHFTYFMKLELICLEVSEENLKVMIEDSINFFKKFCAVEVIKTDESLTSHDIVDVKNKIELGSYGIRKVKNFEWIYGTGLALPRLSFVINKQKGN